MLEVASEASALRWLLKALSRSLEVASQGKAISRWNKQLGFSPCLIVYCLHGALLSFFHRLLSFSQCLGVSTEDKRS
jgi:hypothetical protein